MKFEELKELPADQLQELVATAQKLLGKHEEERKKNAIKQIYELAESVNLKVDIKDREEKPSSVKKAKGAVKFRNPEDPQQTWTGRGKRPKWLVDSLAAGRNLEEFAI